MRLRNIMDLGQISSLKGQTKVSYSKKALEWFVTYPCKCIKITGLLDDCIFWPMLPDMSYLRFL